MICNQLRSDTLLTVPTCPVRCGLRPIDAGQGLRFARPASGIHAPCPRRPTPMVLNSYDFVIFCRIKSLFLQRCKYHHLYNKEYLLPVR